MHVCIPVYMHVCIPVCNAMVFPLRVTSPHHKHAKYTHAYYINTHTHTYTYIHTYIHTYSVTGIAMEEGTQVIYIDTPGIMDARPSERLNKAMVCSIFVISLHIYA
jgi:hypothetical protein